MVSAHEKMNESVVPRLQSQAGSSELGKQLAEVESLLQKQDLLEAQISAHGETITAISRSAALKVFTLCDVVCRQLTMTMELTVSYSASGTRERRTADPEQSESSGLPVQISGVNQQQQVFHL